MFCSCRHDSLALAAVLGLIGQISSACTVPEQPYLPERREDVREYADLLRADFARYFVDVQEYFHCLDAERRSAFLEAQEVSRDYGRFVEILE